MLINKLDLARVFCQWVLVEEQGRHQRGSLDWDQEGSFGVHSCCSGCNLVPWGRETEIVDLGSWTEVPETAADHYMDLLAQETEDGASQPGTVVVACWQEIVGAHQPSLVAWGTETEGKGDHPEESSVGVLEES
jgi:hypothetical protein